MNEIQCLSVAILLFKRILERIHERGHLTANEKSQIFSSIYYISNQFLSSGILNEFSQVGELLGQFNMPWIQHQHLEQKST